MMVTIKSDCPEPVCSVLKFITDFSVFVWIQNTGSEEQHFRNEQISYNLMTVNSNFAKLAADLCVQTVSGSLVLF